MALEAQYLEPISQTAYLSADNCVNYRAIIIPLSAACQTISGF